MSIRAGWNRVEVVPPVLAKRFVERNADEDLLGIRLDNFSGRRVPANQLRLALESIVDHTIHNIHRERLCRSPVASLQSSGDLFEDRLLRGFE